MFRLCHGLNMTVVEAWEHLGGEPLTAYGLRRLTIAVNDAAVLEQAAEEMDKSVKEQRDQKLSTGEAAILRDVLKAMREDR